MSAGGFTARLRALGPDGLADLLARRCDVARRMPDSLDKLAGWLSDRYSVEQAPADLDLFCHEVTQALQLLGDSPTEAELVRLLGPEVDAADLPRALDELQRRALVWPGSRDPVRVAGGLRRYWDAPFGLGLPARRLLNALPATALLLIVQTLHLRCRPEKAEMLDAIVGFLGDPDRVRALVATAPPETRKVLEHLAETETGVRTPAATPLNERLADRTDEPTGWAMFRGLLVESGRFQAELPCEVGLALRGPGYRIVTHPRPPAIRGQAVGPAAPDQAATAVAAVSAVLAESKRTPILLRQAGGVGVREIRRLAKALTLPVSAVELYVDLCAAAGLLAANYGGNELMPTAVFDSWRTESAGQRLLPLVRCWWQLPYLPTHRLTPEGDRIAPATGTWSKAPDEWSGRIVRMRQVSVRILAGLPAGHTADAAHLLEQLRWHCPGALPWSDDDDPAVRLDAMLAEATMLGVIASGQLTALGQALLGGSEQLAAWADSGLSQAAAQATFQADLTAVVAGPPAPALSALLDGVADLETRGAASVWRFSPASVRRALDAGATPDTLLADLREVAARELPQPLEYLIRDTGRRHGEVRVMRVTCCIRSDDTALLAEIANTRRLSDLGLRLLAPTVLASAKSVTETLAQLRAAGFAPIGEGQDGETLVEKPKARRAERAAWREPRTEPEVDVRKLASWLLA